jgi:hypothetical protein
MNISELMSKCANFKNEIDILDNKIGNNVKKYYYDPIINKKRKLLDRIEHLESMRTKRKCLFIDTLDYQELTNNLLSKDSKLILDDFLKIKGGFTYYLLYKKKLHKAYRLEYDILKDEYNFLICFRYLIKYLPLDTIKYIKNYLL